MYNVDGDCTSFGGGWFVTESDEYLAEMDTELFFEAVWWRRYVPMLPEIRRLLAGFDVLDSQEKIVLSERFRRPDGQTLRDIGERLGMTRERVRQIEERSLTALRIAVGAPTNRMDRRTEASLPGGRVRPVEDRDR